MTHDRSSDISYRSSPERLEICGTIPHKDTEEAKLLGLLSNRSLPRYIWTIYETRHSSAVALREHFSPEQIKQGTMHQTNKAFERYFRIGAEDIRGIYQEASSGKKKASVVNISKLKRNK